MSKRKEYSNVTGDEEEKEFSDELTFRGTSKGVTRERHCTSHKVIFVDNLPSSFVKQDLIDLFQEFGEILDVKYLKHKTGPETGYGFVEFAEEKNGRKAIRDRNWKKVEDRIVRVSRAKPSTNKISGTNLYVENVPVDWTDQMLYDHFSRICNISEARILMDKKKEVSRGVGFVHCASNIEAKKAIVWFNNDHLEKNGLKLNVKFAKIPRADRNSQRDRKLKCQPQQKGTNKQSSKDVGESGLSPPSKECGPQPQESNNNGKQGATSVQKRNWYKYNEQALLSHGKGLRLPSAKNPRSLRKSKRRKKTRRRLFQKRQLKKVIKREIQNSENSNIFRTFTDHLNTNSYQRELLVTSNGPTTCEKTIRYPEFPVPNRGENKRVENNIRIQIPNTNMPKIHPPTQFFMNQQYKTPQVGGNIVGNYDFVSAQNYQMSPQGTYPVMCNTQTMQPFEYASSVGTSASSIMSSPVGPTPIRHSTSCTNVQSQNSTVQSQNSTVQANTMYWTGLPVPYAQWQPMANPKNPSVHNKSVKTKVVAGNQMQQFGSKKDFSGFENGSVGGGASRVEFGGHQININPQVGVSQSYYWPESQFMRQEVTPSGFPLQPQQKCWSTDSCSSFDSFSTMNEDFSMRYNTMNRIVPGRVMQYTNVQAQNPIIQTNSVHGSWSNTFDPSQLQYSMSNLSVCCLDTTSDTTSIQSDISVQPFQSYNVFQTTKTSGPAQKVWANHTKMGNNSNGGGKSDLTAKQQGVSPPLYRTHVANSAATKQLKYHNWSTASTCSTEVSSVKNVKQSLKKESVSSNKKPITVCNLPVKVKVISSNNRSETVGFNHYCSANKNPLNDFTQKSKAKKNPFNGFKLKSKAAKNPISGFNLKRHAAKKPVTRGNEKWKVSKSPFTGLNRKPKMEKGRRSFTQMIPKNNLIQTN